MRARERARMKRRLVIEEEGEGAGEEVAEEEVEEHEGSERESEDQQKNILILSCRKRG